MNSIGNRSFVKYFLVGLMWLGSISPAYGTSPEKIESELEVAREDLRISEASKERIAAELDKLKRSGQASPEIINDYEIYLERVQAMVDENRKTVNRMEAAYARHYPRKQPSPQYTSRDVEEMLNPEIQEEHAVDEVAALDRKLNSSLSEFDEMLLKEFNSIRARSAEKMRDLAEEAAEAAKRLEEKGVDLNTGESESDAEAEEGTEEGEKQVEAEKAEGKRDKESVGKKPEGEKDAPDKEKGSDPEKGEVDKTVASPDKSGGGQGATRDRRSRYGKEDDDIVARQLREAAENETDPELKEELWKEYEEYRKNTR